MTTVTTRAQTRKFYTEVERLADIEIDQTNNLLHLQEQHIVYKPYQFIMDEKLIISLLSHTTDKLPKFGGKNNENVVSWLTKITNELNVFKLSDNQKLLMIPSVLTDDARKWYVNNLSIIVDWVTFSKEIQKAFLSPLHRTLAIKQIGNRVQGLGESVLHYYYDIMELCCTIDPEMKDELKVGYLLTGIKVSLQKEVMRRNPKSPDEFLAVAQVEEKLDTSINAQMDYTSTSTTDSLTAIRSVPKIPSSRSLANPSKSIRCYKCNRIVHIARNYFSKNY